MVVLATWTKMCGLGGRGSDMSVMPATLGSRSPLRRLHGAQQVTMLSQVDGPPRERGITWSSVRVPRTPPQYWQVQLSRAKTARRVILRRGGTRGTRPEGGGLVKNRRRRVDGSSGSPR